LKSTNDEGKRVSRVADRRKIRPAVIDPNQFYSIDEAAAARDQSRASLYNDVAAGLLKITKDGTRAKILGAELIRANREQAA
jgi:hypothetical protein